MKETLLNIFVVLVFILEFTQIIVIHRLFKNSENNKIEKIKGRSSFTKNQKKIINKLDEIIDRVNNGGDNNV